jgi:hypothetical protein
MTTYNNTSGSKSVNISVDALGMVRVFYIQNYNGEQQVLQAKTFKTFRSAERYAKKILG